MDSMIIARHANTLSGAAVILALAAVAGWAFSESTVTVTEFEPGTSLVHTESRINQPAERLLQLAGASLCLAAIAIRSWLPFARLAAGLAALVLGVSAVLALAGFLSPSLMRPAGLDELVELNGGCAECDVSTTTGYGVLVALAGSAAAALASATLAAVRTEPGVAAPRGMRSVRSIEREG